MKKIIPNTPGICHLCFEPVWADQSHIFIKGGRAVHKMCYIRQSKCYQQDNPSEKSYFVNKWKDGRVAWRCSRCGKVIWLDPGIYERAYKGMETCLECRASRKDGIDFTLGNKST
ncbi:hypothetical protein [Desulforamulus reducens]|uniref:hypothetical protein n=1 Tax=Desulforamulus reducens TaxID=59610 RepID=UPI00059D85FB|nr:hypothetical protein [Desulforamulus reducens]